VAGAPIPSTSSFARPAAERRFADARGARAADPLAERSPREPLLLRCEPMRSVLERAESVAPTDLTVLLQGETGVGKEVVARRIHEASRRAHAPFVKVHCAALPGSLLETELFGHEAGAFTGALSPKRGRFELAQGGTIFLDEIGEMPLDLQAKLLHVLEDHCFSRVGSNHEVRVDVRVVCASNRKLDEMVAAGTFRRDLFHRIEEVTIRIPPLRERTAEIPQLFSHLLERHCKAMGRGLVVPSPRLLVCLAHHRFPGNVRELENLARRLAALGNEQPILDELHRAALESVRREEIDLADLLSEFEESAGRVPLLEVRRRTIREAERDVIERILVATDYNRTKAARLLGVSYSTLLYKIRSCQVRMPDEA
jgi:DNA-binding NtrC family response regulator